MKIQTVLGDIRPEAAGISLTHEHFSLNFDKFFHAPPEYLSKFFTQGVNEKIHMKNAGFIRQYPYGSKYNINYEDQDTHQAVMNDVKIFKEFGGNTIVENTTCGINRNLKLMYNVSKETGVNVVAGTGYYLGMTQKSNVLNFSVEKMVENYTQEILEGTDVQINQSESVKIKCGIIGEIGSAYPISEFEKRAIMATGEAQSALKCGVTFHPGRDSPNSPFEVMRIYLEAGGDASKCVMSHLDRTIMDDEKLLEYSDLGGYCQYDFFGLECSHFQMNHKIDMPSDAQRIEKLNILKEHGKLNRILMSHDIHTKHRLIDFGGHGFSHIINNVVPKMKTRGFTQEEIDTILVKNPSEWLKF